MVEQTRISLAARKRGCHLVTDEILAQLPQLPQMGLLNLFVMHTSCGLTINENFDPSVRSDMRHALDRIAPDNERLYSHTDEGPDDMPSHIKSTLVGVSLNIPITNGRLDLGTWQGIYLCEFRNYGGQRQLIATIIA